MIFHPTHRWKSVNTLGGRFRLKTKTIAISWSCGRCWSARTWRIWGKKPTSCTTRHIGTQATALIVGAEYLFTMALFKTYRLRVLHLGVVGCWTWVWAMKRKTRMANLPTYVKPLRRRGQSIWSICRARKTKCDSSSFKGLTSYAEYGKKTPVDITMNGLKDFAFDIHFP